MKPSESSATITILLSSIVNLLSSAIIIWRFLFAFTETDVFTEDLLEFSSDETLYAIQEALLENPKLGDVIKGTNGARKGRVANPKAKSGKSGGFRFIYVYLEKADRIYLIFFYSKKEKTNISPETTRQIGELVRALKKIYGES